MGRKKSIILFITLLVTGVTVLFSAMRVSAVDVEDMLPKATSGYAGNTRQEDITWTYDTATKTLTFSGAGEIMSNADNFYADCDGMTSAVTWYIWHEETEHVVIGEGITDIGSHAFHGFNSLIDVSFPRSLQYIEGRAFYECYNTSFKSITIPGNVKVIGNEAFYKCWYLREIIIENGVEEVGDGAFYATKIEEITFPESVRKYGGYVLKGCEKLKKVTLSSSIKEIPSEFFSDCISLQEITIPQSVKKIGNYAFSGTSLKSIKLPKSVVEIGDWAFYEVPLKSIKLPKSVVKIGNWAFYGTSLKTIEIPKDVKVLGRDTGMDDDGVFVNCKKLKTVKIKSRKLKKVAGAFEKFPSKAVIIVPKGKKKSYSKMFYKAGLSKKVKIKESKTW